MKRVLKLAGLSAAAMLASVPVTAIAAPTTLATPFNADNGNDGVMFDVSVLGGPVALQSIGINADAGTFDYSVYYRLGGIGGAMNTPAEWTLLSSFQALTTSGLGAVTLLDITDLDLAGSAKYGFYVTDTQGAFSIAYTNSTGAVGDVLAADNRLSIGVGYGVTYPFGDTSASRAFNGTLNYVAAVPEPASWAIMMIGFALVGTAMRRRRTRVVLA